jgi:hypothetical protein
MFFCCSSKTDEWGVKKEQATGVLLLANIKAIKHLEYPFYLWAGHLEAPNQHPWMLRRF